MAIQNHIHLSTTLGASPEYSPSLKWKVTKHKEIPVVFLTPRYTLGVKLKVNTPLSGGLPVQLTNYEYMVKIQADETYTVEQRATLLKAMNGRVCHFCPINHADDGASHTLDVKQMLVQVGEFPTDHVMLAFYYVKISLMESP